MSCCVGSRQALSPALWLLQERWRDEGCNHGGEQAAASSLEAAVGPAPQQAVCRLYGGWGRCPSKLGLHQYWGLHLHALCWHTSWPGSACVQGRSVFSCRIKAFVLSDLHPPCKTAKRFYWAMYVRGKLQFMNPTLYSWTSSTAMLSRSMFILCFLRCKNRLLCFFYCPSMTHSHVCFLKGLVQSVCQKPKELTSFSLERSSPYTANYHASCQKCLVVPRGTAAC